MSYIVQLKYTENGKVIKAYPKTVANEVYINENKKLTEQLQEYMLCVNTVNDLKAREDLKENMVIKTLGYASINDGNGAEYYIKSLDGNVNSEDIILNKGNLVAIKIKNEINKTSEESNSYYVDLTKWGITNGFLGDREYLLDSEGNPIPKYTNEEYQIAYNNKYGLINALNYAKENGYSNVILPKSDIFICYEEPNSSVTLYWMYKNYPIIIPSGITLDLGGSNIKVIYDSRCKNPYDNSVNSNDNPIYYLKGAVFSFSASYNSTLRNGTLIGDIYERAFDDGGKEKGCEFTTGILVDKGSSFITIENMTIKGFMGDAFTSMTDHDPSKGGTIYIPKFEFRGSISSGVYEETTDGSYSTDYLDISGWNCKEMIMRTNIGYSRVPNFKNQNFVITFYDENKNYITDSTERYLQNILIPNMAKFFRITILQEETNLEIPFTRDFQITPKSGEFCIIRNCEITENHRGGISNMVNNTIIEKCKIFNNGYGYFEGFPQFPDTTRYAINCEDCLPFNLIVRDSYFYNHFNGILFAGGNVTVDNCIFKSMSSCLCLYDCENATFTNNKIFNCGHMISSTGSSIYSRSLIADSNTLINSELGSVSENVSSIVTNTISKGAMGFSTGFDIFDGAIFKFQRADNSYKHAGLSLSNARNVTAYINDRFVSTAGLHINIDETCENIKIYGAKDLYGNINTYVDGAINNTYIENLWLNISATSSDNIVYKKLELNNCKIKNCEVGYGHFVNSGTLNIDYKIDNTSFTIDENISSIFGGSIYNNDVIRNLNLVFENCKFNMNSDSIKKIIDLTQATFIGGIIFENCIFTNNTSNSINLISFGNISNEQFTINLINCKTNGDFAIADSNAGGTFIKDGEEINGTLKL